MGERKLQRRVRDAQESEAATQRRDEQERLERRRERRERRQRRREEKDRARSAADTEAPVTIQPSSDEKEMLIDNSRKDPTDPAAVVPRDRVVDSDEEVEPRAAWGRPLAHPPNVGARIPIDASEAILQAA